MSKVLKANPEAFVEAGSQRIPIGHIAVDNGYAAGYRASVPQVEEMIAKAQMEAEKLIADAQVRAQALLDQAAEDAERIRSEARETGYQEGYQSGKEQSSVDVQAWKVEEQQSLTALGEAIVAQRADQLRDLEPVIERFAMLSVERLLKRELQVASVDISSLVEELLQYAIGGTSVQVRVHPDDYVQARQAQPKWQLLKYGEWSVTVVPDPSLSLGDCEILSDTGRVDARIQTRISELEQALLEASGQEGESTDESDT